VTDGNATTIKNWAFVVLIPALVSSGALNVVLKNQADDRAFHRTIAMNTIKTRDANLSRLEENITQLRRAEIDEHTANMRDYEAQKTTIGKAASFAHGVDSGTIDKRVAAQGTLSNALVLAPSDPKLRKEVKSFQDAVQAAAFANKVHEAVVGNRKASEYAASSAERINELLAADQAVHC
jgi:hypothetical protein